MPNNSYKTFPYIFSSRGLVARYAIDHAPDHTYWNHDNAESRQENSIGSRLGRQAITTNGSNNLPLPNTTINTLGRLKGLTQNYRYVGAGPNVFRRTGDGNGAYTQINGSFVLSGDEFSVSPYRPTLSSFPYIFFADSNVMTKDNGSLATLQQWGIFPPTAPPQSFVTNFATVSIDDFQSSPGAYTAAGFTGSLTSVMLVNTFIGTPPITTAPGVITVTPDSMFNIIPNAELTVTGEPNDVVVISTTEHTFTAFFQNNHPFSDDVINSAIRGVVPVSGTATITRAFSGNLGMIGNSTTGPGDYINLGIEISAELGSTFTVLFDVGDGTFTQSYYTYTFVDNVPLPSPPQHPGPPGGIGSNPPGNPKPTQPSGVNSFLELAIPISKFALVGQAGLAGSTWANVNSWRIQIVNGSSTVPLTATVNDFYLFGGGGPDASVGLQYDYRITFYNINTGNESGPSVVQVNTLNPVNQAVEITWADAVTPPPPPLDPQITHVKVYRRGGTLPDQWLQVGLIPIGTTSMVDLLTDEQIAESIVLNIDTAPPVTSALSVVVNTTLFAAVAAVGEATVQLGSVANVYVNQNLTIDPLTASAETVIVQSISGNNIKAYFQFTHRVGAVVSATTRTGQPCSIACIAFDQAWVAGDPNNPNILYYSDRFNPESFPLENTLEIGVPSDPIMANVEWNGQVYTFTQNTVYNVLTASVTGNVPLPYKTAAQHGLNAPFGYVVTEGEIWYQANGGIYVFQGSESVYMSEAIEWVFTEQFIDDDLVRPVVPMNPAAASQTIMSYYQNEVYVSYVGTDGNRHRVIYSRIYKRWRNDDAPANAMLVEQDTYKLIYGNTVGMIYQDRVGNFDSGGFITGVQQFVPINFNLQTVALDMGLPKNYKNYNELTLDIDTGGIDVNVDLVFDNGMTPLSLGTVNSDGRNQYDLQVNAGAGYLSLNVCLQLTATIQTAITSPVTIYESHIRANVEAELRKSYDSYIMDFSGPDYKVVKQAWIEYMALDPAGITFTVYVGANTAVSAPNNLVEFTFTLPQSTTRTSKRVRFPATKARIWRWIATSNSDFRIYSDSSIEFNPITKDKGYAKLPLQQPEPTQP